MKILENMFQKVKRVFLVIFLMRLKANPHINLCVGPLTKSSLKRKLFIRLCKATPVLTLLLITQIQFGSRRSHLRYR